MELRSQNKSLRARPAKTHLPEAQAPGALEACRHDLRRLLQLIQGSEHHFILTFRRSTSHAQASSKRVRTKCETTNHGKHLRPLPGEAQRVEAFYEQKRPSPGPRRFDLVLVHHSFITANLSLHNSTTHYNKQYKIHRSTSKAVTHLRSLPHDPS